MAADLAVKAALDRRSAAEPACHRGHSGRPATRDDTLVDPGLPSWRGGGGTETAYRRGRRSGSGGRRPRRGAVRPRGWYLWLRQGEVRFKPSVDANLVTLLGFAARTTVLGRRRRRRHSSARALNAESAVRDELGRVGLLQVGRPFRQRLSKWWWCPLGSPRVSDYTIPEPEPKEIDEQTLHGARPHGGHSTSSVGIPQATSGATTAATTSTTTKDLSYCWHPKVRILVGGNWWCQWWEEIPAEGGADVALVGRWHPDFDNRCQKGCAAR